MKARVSVILPSLNVRDYISQCMDSVIHQTLQEIEIICVDAGSNDGTLEVLKQFKERDQRIVIINSVVKSYGFQVNEGIKRASGEYVAVVETDDYIEPHMLEELYRLASYNKLDFIKANAEVVYNKKNRLIRNRLNLLGLNTSLYNRVINIRTNPELLAMDYYIWRGIYKKDFLLSNNITCNETKGAAYQDIGFTHQVAAKADRAMYIEASYYRYRIFREGSSSQNTNGLQYTYTEYNRLLRTIKYNEIIPHEALAYFYVRMFRAVKIEIDHILRLLAYNIHSPKLGIYYDYFKEIYVGAYDDCLHQNYILSDNERQQLEILFTSLEEYSNRLANIDMEENNKKMKLLERIGKSNVIIFGCGQYGNEVMEILQSNDICIDSLCDNNQILWNTQINEISVISVAKAVSQFYEDTFVIANKKYYEEMKQQLIDCGVNEQKIIRYK